MVVAVISTKSNNTTVVVGKLFPKPAQNPTAIPRLQNG